MGALAGGATKEQLGLIDGYGTAIGLAFQIVDDILDVTATAEQMGKKTGKDAQIGKLTYPSLIGLEASRKHLAETMRRPLQLVNNIIHGRAGISAETALDLAEVFETSAQFWMNLDSQYRLSIARRKRAEQQAS